MGKTIAIISPFSGFTKMLQEIRVENEEDIEVVEAVGDKALKCAKDLERVGCKAIIARNYTGDHMEEAKLAIPVIDLKIMDFDLLLRMRQLVNSGMKRIGCIFYSKELMDYDFNSYKDILGAEIIPLPYHSLGSDIDIQIEYAISNEVDIVLTTGSCILKRCSSYGMRAGVVYPGRSSVLQAIQRAKETIAAHDSYAEYNRRLQTIINSTRDGVLVTDHRQIVIMINQMAEKILNRVADEIVGKEAGSLSAGFNQAPPAGCSEEEKIISYGDKQLVLKRTPLQLDDHTPWGTLYILQDVSEVQRLDQQIRAENIAKGLQARFALSDFRGKSIIARNIKSQAEQYACSDSTILIIGDSGTGKELIAQGIHNSSHRSYGPFVAVNCASLPETLLESELFGYAKGAFTGADRYGKAGLFELAHQGTIFLDEIGDFPIALQAKLLRVLQEKEVRRIGSDRVIPMDVRVLAATNKDLLEEVKKGNFRKDLYYRLNVLNINLPSLLERKEDIEELANLFIGRYRQKIGKKMPLLNFTQINKLLRYHWPGNVRELENFVERYVLLYKSEHNNDYLIDQFLRDTISRESAQNRQNPDVLEIRIGPLREMELQILVKLVEGYKLDKNRVADLLGISRTTLWKRLKNVGG
jgi:transcriptional regulator with PAS, ATPase and Fis domain